MQTRSTKPRKTIFALIAVAVLGMHRGVSAESNSAPNDAVPKQGATVSSSEAQSTTAAPSRKAPPGMQASPLESTNILRSFLTRGVILGFPEGGKSVVIRHEEIPGFMPKMTMEFEVRDPKEINGLAVGDNVIFNIRATQEDSWIDGLRRAGTNDVIDVTPKDPSSAALLHVATLKPGDPMPDAQLLAEDGRTIRFSDYKGKALAFTFIFTRCPLPNYCPRMNINFKEARELLLVDVGGPANWEFLSISFDPEFDKPGVLTRYAFSYRGAITNQWVFAAAPKETLAVMSPQLDFRFANEQGSFQHNLRTIVLDASGRVYRFFEGNKWTPEELAAAMTEAASKGEQDPQGR